MNIFQIRASNLRKLMYELGGQNKLVEAAGKSQSQISRLLAPESSNSRKNIGEKLAREIEKNTGKAPLWLDSQRKADDSDEETEYLNPPLLYSLATDVTKKPSLLERIKSSVAEPDAKYDNGGKVPLISSVQAGNFREAIDNFFPGDAEQWIPCHIPKSSKSFALRVEGPSMEPEFKAGEIIVVDPERAAVTGSYVIAKRAKDDFVTFKQLVQTEGKNYLKALNPEWPTRIIEIDGDWQICGVIIYAHRVYV